MANRLTLPTPLQLAHDWVGRVLRPGAIAVDGTVGNGHDTLFLAQRVGPSGHVIGVDIQADAIARTRARAAAAGLFEVVRLFQEGHERLAARLAAEGVEGIAAAMFNLGYLPGGDKRCITRPESTLQALAVADAALVPGGLLSVMLYLGHPGGEEESAAVVAWARALPRATRSVFRYQPLQSPHAPTLLVVERLHEQR